MKAIDLCAGAGGLSRGLHLAGFKVRGVERVPRAVETHRYNVGPCELADIATWRPPHRAELVAGGVPCQPFSTQGARRGFDEEHHHGSLFGAEVERRGHLYEHLIRVAVEAEARAVLLENVPGLGQWNEGAALAAIVAAMRAAGFVRVEVATLDAADYGVPQHRKRLFVAGIRGGASEAFRWPDPTRGLGRIPWVTVREALRPTGNLLEELERAGLADRPATTISAGGCGRLARPGHKVDGDQWKGCVRLNTEQCATLQGFPTGFRFAGTTSEVHAQIGNAVPPALGEVVGRSVLDALRPVPSHSGHTGPSPVCGSYASPDPAQYRQRREDIVSPSYARGLP